MTAPPHSSLLSHFTSWNDLSGQPVVVTYSFATDVAWSFSAAQQASARLALAAWDAVCGLSFVEVPDVAAGAGIDLRFRLDTMPSLAVLGHATLPPEGDVALSVALFRGDSLAPSATRIGFHLLLHEIGHALGLAHPDPAIPGAAAHTLMIETLGRGTPARAPLDWDRAAVQDLYGTAEAEAALGLRWSWDEGLRAVRGEGTPADDILTGTAHRDALFGGAGQDLLQGGAGDDLLTPGAGDDVVEGGAGRDTLRLDAPRATLRLDPAGAVEGAEGRDRFSSIEAIATLDGTEHLAAGGALGQLVGLYEAAFGRAPDAGGLAFWAATWRQHPDLTHIAGQFLGSPEFQAGPGLAARFAALGEARPAGDDATALAWLAGRAETADLFATGIWVAEPDALLVSAMYATALGRAPDEAGYRFWLDGLRAGLPEESLAQGFQGSPEAASRGGTGHASDEALLGAARAGMWLMDTEALVFL